MQPRIQLQSTFTLNLACNPYRPTSMFAGHSCAKAWYGCTVMAAWQPKTTHTSRSNISVFKCHIVSDLCAIVCLPLLTILFPQELQTRILLALQDAFLRSTNLHTLVAVPLYHKFTSRDQAPVLSWWLSLLYAASKHENMAETIYWAEAFN